MQHIDRRLNILLGPPAPTTAQQRVLWNDTHMQTTPILEPWNPPARIGRTSDGGFALSQNTVCFQRGYSPQTVFDQYVDIYSDRFNNNKESSVECIAGLAHDFLVVLKSSPAQVAAGCMVQFRCSIDGRQPPYLYISSLCTHRDHCGRRLAQQLTHSVFTLGALMLEQDPVGNTTWRNAIPHKELYVGLAVRKTFGCDTDKRLIRLYQACGMATRQMDPKTPRIDYRSFTHYSIYDWRLDSTESIVAMWKHVQPGVLYYSDGGILDPSKEDGELMYYEFPPEDLALVRASGIVHKQHAYLHPPGAVHVSNAEEITFTRKAPVAGRGVFCIKTENIKTDKYNLKISIPAYFAASIHANSVIQ